MTETSILYASNKIVNETSHHKITEVPCENIQVDRI